MSETPSGPCRDNSILRSWYLLSCGRPSRMRSPRFSLKISPVACRYLSELMRHLVICRHSTRSVETYLRVIPCRYSIPGIRLPVGTGGFISPGMVAHCERSYRTSRTANTSAILMMTIGTLIIIWLRCTMLCRATTGLIPSDGTSIRRPAGRFVKTGGNRLVPFRLKLIVLAGLTRTASRSTNSRARRCFRGGAYRNETVPTPWMLTGISFGFSELNSGAEELTRRRSTIR
jgi:hypothetical protein